MLNKVVVGSISFNDNDNYFIDGVPGLANPPTRIASYDMSGEHFGRFANVFYGRRRFSLRGFVKGASATDFITKRDNLMAAFDAFDGEVKIKFTLSNNRVVEINGVLVSIDFDPTPGWVSVGQFSAQFEASFPFLLSNIENSQNISLPYGGGGKVPPDTMPMGLAADQGGSITAVNSGTAVSYPTARINGPVTDPALRNDTTGKEIRFTITLATGEYLDIDFKLKTVTDWTGRNRYGVKSGDWWFLQKGSNLIKFLAAAFNSSALTDFKWRDSYLGL